MKNLILSFIFTFSTAQADTVAEDVVDVMSGLGSMGSFTVLVENEVAKIKAQLIRDEQRIRTEAEKALHSAKLEHKKYLLTTTEKVLVVFKKAEKNLKKTTAFYEELLIVLVNWAKQQEVNMQNLNYTKAILYKDLESMNVENEAQPAKAILERTEILCKTENDPVACLNVEISKSHSAMTSDINNLIQTYKPDETLKVLGMAIASKAAYSTSLTTVSMQISILAEKIKRLRAEIEELEKKK